ncbi:MAG: Formate--tetrahydrofolate ligase [Gammaproteobacteria bacterium]|nr:Formate--tetrahydrofolate ligase [Gammaproteobacteria bacterium]
MAYKSDIEIAREANPIPIRQVAQGVGIPEDAFYPYAYSKGKIDLDYIAGLSERPDGNLVLVTAITPTPAGEGKTTTTVGLGDALNRIGKKATICIREPSLGPCFGVKGGAAGGGYAQVIPMEDINLHFTGDFHAIGTANNLLCALIDNHITHGNSLDIDVRKISFKRVVDMNDRALRRIVCSLGGAANGFPREDGFDITVASEVMAIFCLATDRNDLQRRLANIVVAENTDRKPVYARDLNADGAMAVLLKDALMPNLVQTLENNPAMVHGGPFANIAHGCNSVIATKAGLKLADYVITEAGFGADLGAEKFFDIKCRKAGLSPKAAVIVATIRALKMHGGVEKAGLGAPNADAVSKGCGNLVRHIQNVKAFGVPVIVAINQFVTDTEEEIQAVKDAVAEHGVEAIGCSHWEHGGAGAEDLARGVVKFVEANTARFAPIYEDGLSLWDKVKTVATRIYGADDIIADKVVRIQFKKFEKQGFGHFPICVAKTQYSFSTDPNLKGAPQGHVVPIREVKLSAGAEFLVVVCGDIMTMPGLPKVPAADHINLDQQGRIAGLF